MKDISTNLTSPESVWGSIDPEGLKRLADSCVQGRDPLLLQDLSASNFLTSDALSRRSHPKSRPRKNKSGNQLNANSLDKAASLDLFLEVSYLDPWRFRRVVSPTSISIPVLSVPFLTSGACRILMQ